MTYGQVERAPGPRRDLLDGQRAHDRALRIERSEQATGLVVHERSQEGLVHVGMGLGGPGEQAVPTKVEPARPPSRARGRQGLAGARDYVTRDQDLQRFS
jgi:hypothetical protein